MDTIRIPVKYKRGITMNTTHNSLSFQVIQVGRVCATLKVVVANTKSSLEFVIYECFGKLESVCKALTAASKVLITLPSSSAVYVTVSCSCTQNLSKTGFQTLQK